MSNQDVVMEFLDRFCAGDINGLTSLLAEDLHFRGPFHRFNSRASYIDSLKSDPPENAIYRVLSLTEGADSVSVYYEYQKKHRATTIAQLFTFKHGKIAEILLVFDSGELR